MIVRAPTLAAGGAADRGAPWPNSASRAWRPTSPFLRALLGPAGRASPARSTPASSRAHAAELVAAPRAPGAMRRAEAAPRPTRRRPRRRPRQADRRAARGAERRSTAPASQATRAAPFERRAGRCSVRAGQTVAILEAMKMEHVVAAPRRPASCARRRRPRARWCSRASRCSSSHREAVAGEDGGAEAEAVDLDAIRPDLAEVWSAAGASPATRRGPRPSARRRKTGPAHRPGEHRRPARSRHLHRIRRPRPGRPAPAPLASRS